MAKMGGSVGDVIAGLAQSNPNMVAAQLKEMDEIEQPQPATPPPVVDAATALDEVIAQPPASAAPGQPPEAAPLETAAEPIPSEPPAAQDRAAEVEALQARLDAAEAEVRRYIAAHRTVSGMHSKEREKAVVLTQQVESLTARIAELEESAKAHPASGTVTEDDDGLSEDDREALGPDALRIFRKMLRTDRAKRETQSKSPKAAPAAQPAADQGWESYLAQLDALIPNRAALLADSAYQAWVNAPGTYRREMITSAEAARDAVGVSRIVEGFKASTPPAAAPSARKPGLDRLATPPSRSAPPPLSAAGASSARRYTEAEANQIIKKMADQSPIYGAGGVQLDQAQREAALKDVWAAYREGRVT